ncbi:hypothetical protein ABT088_53915 [Streptomyces mirabilis]|uniref:hypothetical protein n=1 Tax=Streptomyces mirabilis TaxID=68239 RepID=UPI003317E31C
MEQPQVVGVDGSAPSLLAVDWAVDEAARWVCRHGWCTPSSRRSATKRYRPDRRSRSPARGAPGAGRSLHGGGPLPRGTGLRPAGHRGQSSLGLRPGRIAHALPHHAQCPVAVVPLSG